MKHFCCHCGRTFDSKHEIELTCINCHEDMHDPNWTEMPDIAKCGLCWGNGQSIQGGSCPKCSGTGDHIPGRV